MWYMWYISIYKYRRIGTHMRGNSYTHKYIHTYRFFLHYKRAPGFERRGLFVIIWSNCVMIILLRLINTQFLFASTFDTFDLVHSLADIFKTVTSLVTNNSVVKKAKINKVEHMSTYKLITSKFRAKLLLRVIISVK